MKVLISYYSKTGVTEKIAKKMAESVELNGNAVTLHKVLPMQELKAHHYKKLKEIDLNSPLLDVNNFDLVVVGTPVWGFSPTPIILSYIRQLQGVKNKCFAIFASCTALPGSTVKKISNILTTSGAVVVDSMVVKSIFDLDETRLKQASDFAQNLLRKAKEF